MWVSECGEKEQPTPPNCIWGYYSLTVLKQVNFPSPGSSTLWQHNTEQNINTQYSSKILHTEHFHCVCVHSSGQQGTVMSSETIPHLMDPLQAPRLLIIHPPISYYSWAWPLSILYNYTNINSITTYVLLCLSCVSLPRLCLGQPYLSACIFIAFLTSRTQKAQLSLI